MPTRARNGKKLPGMLEQLQASLERQAPLRVMFQDEARFGRISDCRRCWRRRRLRPLVRKMLSRQYTHVFGAVSALDGQFDTLVLPQADTACMQLFLDEVARRHSQDNIIMVLDGAGWHTAGGLIEQPSMRLLLLAPYSPELNPVEYLWDELGENTCGMSLGENTFTTEYSPLWMRSSNPWQGRSALSSRTPNASRASVGGIGSLRHR